MGSEADHRLQTHDYHVLRLFEAAGLVEVLDVRRQRDRGRQGDAVVEFRGVFHVRHRLALFTPTLAGVVVDFQAA